MKNRNGHPRPDFRARLNDAFKTALKARGGSEPAGKNRHRFTVISPKFRGLTHLARQDLVWSIANDVLSDDELLKITVILPFAPEEVGGYDRAMKLEAAEARSTGQK